MAALFALVLAALLPSAVMATARPGEALVLCTAEGPKTISVDEDGNAPPALDGSACAACVFPHAAVLPEPPLPEPASVPAVRPRTVWTPSRPRLQPPARAPPRPPSTAPPVA